MPEKYLPESEQYSPRSLLTALSSTKQSAIQVDLLLGTTDLEALNYNGTYLGISCLVKTNSRLNSMVQ